MAGDAPLEEQNSQHMYTESITTSCTHAEGSSVDTTNTKPAFLMNVGDEDFARWRPKYHLQAPYGWMNDPCAPGYDSSTDTYLVAFQWNPKGYDWEDIAWGQARSKDLVNWEVDGALCLKPDEPYDVKGVFTGCLLPSSIHEQTNGNLTAIYTSVSKLPIHYTLPYSRGCETLSLAISCDGGSSWHKHSSNPILDGPPSELDVTAWRDPFVGPWPAMDLALGRETKDRNHLYGIISGGIREKSPTTFLYLIEPLAVDKAVVSNIVEATYIGPLIQPGLNFRPSIWSGDFGVNWEVTNHLSLSDDFKQSRDFLVMSAEGLITDESVGAYQHKLAQRGRVSRSVQWLSGSLLQTQNTIEMKYEFGGIFDHGCFYATSSFWDSKHQQRVIWGWITEEDLSDDMRAAQGWSGMLSLPRAVKLQTIRGVIKARSSELSALTNISATANINGSYTIQTLGIHPAAALKQLRRNAHRLELLPQPLYAPARNKGINEQILEVTSLQWEMDYEVNVGLHCSHVGFSIFHSADRTSCTTFSFSPGEELITISRPSSLVTRSQLNSATESARHTLFTTVDSHGGKSSEESLKVRAYYDTSVLEVFVNGRTVISTRIYTYSEGCFGIQLFADSKGDLAGETLLCKAIVWDGLGASLTMV